MKLLALTTLLFTLTTPVPLEELKPKVEQHEFTYREVPVKQEYETIQVNATFYTAFCNTGCIGITKMGHDVRNKIDVEGYRVIAVDPDVIPLGKIVFVELENGTSFEAITSDTGAHIVSNRIDVLVSTEQEAYNLGRMKAQVTILEDY